MNNIELITSVYVLIDDAIKQIKFKPKPGPMANLSHSELFTIMLVQPMIMPFCDTKRFYNAFKSNYLELFPKLPSYNRLMKIYEANKEYLIELMKVLASPNDFGFVVDGTTISTMEAIRGKFAKSFRDARKVYCTSKHKWDFGYILILIMDQHGTLPFVSMNKEHENIQFKELSRVLKDSLVLADRGFRGKDFNQKLWEEQQVKVKITGGKERQWIENVIGFLKDKLGLERIRKIRKNSSFSAKVFSILCAYNAIILLNLPI
jgi:hypothetical protein